MMKTIFLTLTLLGLVSMTVATGNCAISSLTINMGQDDCDLSNWALQNGHSETHCDTKLTCTDGTINAVHDSMPYFNLHTECVKLEKVTTETGSTHLECTG